MEQIFASKKIKWFEGRMLPSSAFLPSSETECIEWSQKAEVSAKRSKMPKIFRDLKKLLKINIAIFTLIPRNC